MRRDDLDLQMARHWLPRHVEIEPARLATAWYDYRHAHPVLRSHFFYNAYTLAWRRAHRHFFDRSVDVSGVVPWPGERRCLYANKPQTIQRALDVMHFIDELGMPYDVFFDAAIAHFMQEREYYTVWRQKAKRFRGAKLPPAALLKDARAAIAAQQRFEKICRTSLVHARHPHYRASNWQGTAWQEAHMRWLCAEMRHRGTGCARGLAALVYERDALSERMVARVFGVEMVRRLRALRDTL